ncbi:MAG: IS4/IS5 family transposase, partial [Planctomycetaceae bacterium]
YNLIRQSMLQSALAADCRPQQLSFAASLQMLANTWLFAAAPLQDSVIALERLAALRILNGHSHRVGNRPNRAEPRAVKRRPKPLALLTEPRATAKARLVAGQKS